MNCSSSSLPPNSFSPNGHLRAIVKATFETYCDIYKRSIAGAVHSVEYPQDNGVYVRKEGKLNRASYVLLSGIITSASSEDCRTVIEGDFNSTEDRCNGRYLVWNNCHSSVPCLVIQGELKRINELGHWAAINGFEYNPRLDTLTRVIEGQKFLLNKIESSKDTSICFYDALYNYFVNSTYFVISAYLGPTDIRDDLNFYSPDKTFHFARVNRGAEFKEITLDGFYGVKLAAGSVTLYKGNQQIQYESGQSNSAYVLLMRPCLDGTTEVRQGIISWSDSGDIEHLEGQISIKKENKTLSFDLGCFKWDNFWWDNTEFLVDDFIQLINSLIIENNVEELWWDEDDSRQVELAENLPNDDDPISFV